MKILNGCISNKIFIKTENNSNVMTGGLHKISLDTVQALNQTTILHKQRTSRILFEKVDIMKCPSTKGSAKLEMA